MFNNITILYVEDEESIRKAILNIFPQLFKEVISGVDGEEGLALFKEHQDKIDLIITDINMPKLNGLEMLNEIKSISPFIPMLITTAHNDTDFLHKAIDVGVTGYITKPIDIRKLLDVVKKNIMPTIEKKQLEIQIELQRENEVKNAKFSAIGQLSAGITHEINTPLTYIKGTFEMMTYDIEDLPQSTIREGLLKDVVLIKDGLQRMENIISSMKEMAAAGTTQKENTNIISSLLVSLTMTQNKIKHISSVYINNEKFTTLMKNENQNFILSVQKQRIEQVWIIIINNAMDELIKIDDFYSRRLDIFIEKNVDNNIVVKFKDNAGGIKDEIIDKLFEAFKSTKESSGMGVGLNIAQKIIMEHDASISAYNEDDGAVFEIVFKS